MNAIILGTGADELGFNGYEKKLGSNHYGEYEYYQKDDIVIIPRHKMGHSVAPHLINYRANIHALKDLDVKNVVSIYAVGSISNKLLPSEFGIISDHVDFTHSRINTFFDGTFYPLDHVNAENQFSEKLKSCALALNKEIKKDLIYVTTQGPRLETKAEIRMFNSLGFDCVGMTLSTEADLINELELNNLAIAYSINMAAGLARSGLEFIGKEKELSVAKKVFELALEVLNNV